MVIVNDVICCILYEIASRTFTRKMMLIPKLIFSVYQFWRFRTLSFRSLEQHICLPSFKNQPVLEHQKLLTYTVVHIILFESPNSLNLHSHYSNSYVLCSFSIVNKYSRKLLIYNDDGLRANSESNIIT